VSARSLSLRNASRNLRELTARHAPYWMKRNVSTTLRQSRF